MHIAFLRGLLLLLRSVLKRKTSKEMGPDSKPKKNPKKTEKTKKTKNRNAGASFSSSANNGVKQATEWRDDTAKKLEAETNKAKEEAKKFEADTKKTIDNAQKAINDADKFFAETSKKADTFAGTPITNVWKTGSTSLDENIGKPIITQASNDAAAGAIAPYTSSKYLEDRAKSFGKGVNDFFASAFGPCRIATPEVALWLGTMEQSASGKLKNLPDRFKNFARQHYYKCNVDTVLYANSVWVRRGLFFPFLFFRFFTFFLFQLLSTIPHPSSCPLFCSPFVSPSLAFSLFSAHKKRKTQGTMEKTATTVENHIYFPSDIDVEKNPCDAHWMLHELEHCDQYAANGGKTG